MHISELNDAEYFGFRVNSEVVPPQLCLEVATRSNERQRVTVVFTRCYHISAKILGTLGNVEGINYIDISDDGRELVDLQSAAPPGSRQYRIFLTSGSEIVIVSDSVSLRPQAVT